MLAPIRPRPTIPSCVMASSPFRSVICGSGGSAPLVELSWRRSGSRLARELRRDPLGQHLAELDAPLIERVDAPDRALGEHVVLVERDELARAPPASAGRPGSCWWTVALERPMRDERRAALGATSSAVLPNASASACAKTFAISRSWWSPERVQRLCRSR